MVKGVFTNPIERSEKISQALLGKKRGPLTQEHKDKLRQSNLGKKRSDIAKSNMSAASKGKRKSNTHRLNISNSRKKLFKEGLLNNSGENSSRWKGGLTPLNKAIRNLPEYKTWRLNIYIRDKFMCQNCRLIGSGNLEAHHIVFLSHLICDNNIKNIEDAIKCKELWCINNGITVCHNCHKLAHTYGGENGRS